jgi:hypothetical protein
VAIAKQEPIMIRETAHTNETETNFTAGESELRPRLKAVRPIEAWYWVLITVMSFLLGLTVIIDSVALIGLA